MKRDFFIGKSLKRKKNHVWKFILLILYEYCLCICRLKPDRTLATKRLAGRKVNKERLSVALCANADGSHKLKPLIIGKFKRPRCFKNIRIQTMPMTYRNNAKAWMITLLFQEWVQEFDRQAGLKHQGQRVLLLLNNCSSHKLTGLNLRYTDVHFLPPNTTSKI